MRELAARAREERAGLSRYDEPVAGGGMGSRKPTAAAAAGRDSESEDEGEEKVCVFTCALAYRVHACATCFLAIALVRVALFRTSFTIISVRQLCPCRPVH